MINIGIFETGLDNMAEVKDYLRYYATEKNIIIKQKVFYDVNILVQEPADICLIDFKAYVDNKEILTNWQIESGRLKFIFVTSDILNIVDFIQNHPEEYCILSPIEKESLFKVLDNVKSRIRKQAIVAKLGHSGEQRIYIENLNYIDITNRNLRYHLADGTEVNSQTLRQSFSKEVGPLLINPELFFIPPSLLINLTNIEKMYNDHLEFANGTVLYFPKTASDRIRDAWTNFLI